MKRLFSRRDKDKAVRSSATESVSVDKETTSAQNELTHSHTDASNGFLSPYAAPVSRKRSLFFGSARGPAKSVQHSHSGSDAGSNTLTSRSTSGSSDASSSLVSTPVDEPLTPLGTETPPTETKSWPSTWASSLGKAKAAKSLQTQQQPVKPSPASPSASSFTNVLRSRVTASTRPQIPRVSVESSVDSEQDSDDSSWDEIQPNEITRPRKTLRVPASGQRQQSPNSRRTVFGGAVTSSPLTRETSKALANLHALTLDALVPPTSAPPLVQTPSAVPFPRSSNKVHLHPAIVNIIHAQHSPLHMEILRKRLLRRIERRVLTATEQASIHPLATRSAKPRDANKRRLPAAEETYEDSKAVGGGWSKGMKRWAMRPCFEERVVVWKPHASGVIPRPVERDNRCGVAALEFSEGAEALAGLHRQNELPPPPSDIYVPASNRKLPPPLVIPRAPHGMMTNSDARSLGMVSSRTRIGQSKLRPPPMDMTALAAQDEDDLPLGMVVLQRRQKEEIEERKRRAAAEKAERERKAREEEEKKRLFAEQVAAARQRREGERLGKNGKKDSWLEGEVDALPPPVRPYASTGRSNSNPNLSMSNSLQAPKPQFERRQTSASSIISSSATVTTKRQEPVRQQTVPPSLPSPWTGIAYPGSAAGVQYGFPMPVSAPATMRNYNMMMLPPQPDPVSMAMFEQGLLHPWAMNHGTGSTGALTPPRAPFGLSSSGDSAGSLTPPRFPSSRPSSWGSSNEDVWMMMQNAGSSSGTNPDPHDRSRRSKSSMLASPVDERRSRSHSKSPTDATSPGYGRQASSVNGSSVPKSQEKRHSRQISSMTAPSAPSRQQPSSSSTPNLHVPPLPTRPRENSATMSKLNPAQANRTPYGLPSSENYAPVSNASKLQSLSNTSQRESSLAPSASKDTLKKTSSFLSLTQRRDGGSLTTRKSKLFS